MLLEILESGLKPFRIPLGRTSPEKKKTKQPPSLSGQVVDCEPAVLQPCRTLHPSLDPEALWYAMGETRLHQPALEGRGKPRTHPVGARRRPHSLCRRSPLGTTSRRPHWHASAAAVRRLRGGSATKLRDDH